MGLRCFSIFPLLNYTRSKIRVLQSPAFTKDHAIYCECNTASKIGYGERVHIIQMENYDPHEQSVTLVQNRSRYARSAYFRTIIM